MSKLWEKYSYVIIFISLIYLFSFILINQTDQEEQLYSEYIHVVVNEGDTLWSFAEKYAEHHQLSREEFIDWIEKTNQIVRNDIVAGSAITIPVTINDINSQSIARSE